MSSGMLAMLMGITAGFITLIGLYLWLVGNDVTTGVVLLGVASSTLALLPVATRRNRCAGN